MSVTLSPTGGVPPFTWAVAPGSSLPPGLSFYSGTSLNSYSSNQTVGLTYLQGAPTAAAAYSFDLVATDSVGANFRRTFTLNVSPLAVFSSGLKTATTNVPYSQQITAVGGTPPYSFTYALSGLNTDMLPPGFTTSPTGLISGTTTSTGAFGFMATAHDAAGHTFTMTYNYGVTNASGLEVTTSMPAGVRAGVGFTTSLSTNGVSTYTWTVASGALPPGVTLNGNVLTGPASAAGIYNFTVRATDTANSSNFADRAYTLRVQPMQPITHRLSELPPARTGTSYSQTLEVAGGTPPYTFSTTPLSPLPPGLTLSSAGVLSGIPTATGNFSFTYVVTDSLGAQGYLTTLPFNVLAPGAPNPLQGRTLTFDQGSVGVPYAGQLDGLLIGGTSPFTWTVAPGSTLPPGLAILPGSNGVSSYLGGIPTASTTYQFTLIATDSVGRTAENPITLHVSPIVASPATFANGVVGAPYSATFTSAGGTPPYTVSLVTASSLPPGLSLSSTGTLSGTPTVPGVFTVNVMIADQAGHQLFTPRVIVIDTPTGQARGIGMPDTIHLNYMLTGPAPAAVPINVTRTTGALPFTAALEGVAGASLSPTSGSAPAALNLSLNTASLTAGTYAGVIAVNSPQSANLFTHTPVVLTVINPVHLVVSAPSPVPVGTPFSFTVSAQDASNTVVPGYFGTVHFTSSDPQAVLPADATLTNGTGTLYRHPEDRRQPDHHRHRYGHRFRQWRVDGHQRSGAAAGAAGCKDPRRELHAGPERRDLHRHRQQHRYDSDHRDSDGHRDSAHRTDTVFDGRRGWTCTGNTCTRADALAAGGAYPAITVTVNVAANAPSLVTNQISASGGGSLLATAADPTTIRQSAPDCALCPITPCRIADTRNPIGPFGGPSLAGGASRDFIVPNSPCGVPANAQAYSLNVAVVPGGPLGFLTLWPTGQPQPVASTLNSLDGRIKSNAAIVPAGTGGAISVFASNPTDRHSGYQRLLRPGQRSDGPGVLSRDPLPHRRYARARPRRWPDRR